MSFEEEEALEHTLLVVREVSVYKIPPRSSSGGYKCGEWLQSDKIWSGRLRVVSCKERCEIRLEDPNSGDLFATCFFLPGQRENSVETVLDSSRYFVLKIEDGRGKHAFIGLGFNERNEAFDFNVALSDHEKYVKREHERDPGEENEEGQIDIHPAVNHRLKMPGFTYKKIIHSCATLSQVTRQKDHINEGETIRINVKNKPSTGTGMLSSAGIHGGSSGTGKAGVVSGTGKVGGFLAPPPSDTPKIRSPLPQPPNDPVAARMSHNIGHLHGSKESTRHGADPLSDLTKIERSLPQVTGSGSAKGTASGWAAF